MGDRPLGVVITGAAGDLGRDLVRSFLADGYTVFAADVVPQTGEDGLVPVVLDVTKRAAVLALAARAGGEAATVIALIGAAGIALLLGIAMLRLTGIAFSC